MASVVVFDFKDTLALVAREGPTLADAVLARGYSLPAAATNGELTSDARSETAFKEHVRKLREDALRAAGVADDDIGPIIEEVVSGRRQLRMDLFPDVVPVLEALRSRGVVLAVCSNWDWDLDERLEELGVGKYFSVVTSSARCGYWKPHPAIFSTVLESVGFTAGQVVFAGDNYAHDIVPAAEVGMRPFHVHRVRCDHDCSWGDETLATLLESCS